jgi:hypothetical protein
MPRLSRILSAVLLTLWLDPAAGDPLSAQQRVAWDRFTAIAGAGASVRWSAVDDVPVSVRAAAGISLPRFSIDRAAAVRSMFVENGELFRLRSGIDDMQVAGESEHHGVHHLRMSQTYRGVPVRGGQYMVSVGADGRLRMIGGRSVPDVDADVNPVVRRERAIAAAATSLRLASANPSTASLAIEPAEGPDRLVWQVVLGATGRAGEWEVLVDARDGSIVGSRSRAFGATDAPRSTTRARWSRFARTTS